MEDLVSKKNASSPIWQYFGFKAGENGEPKDLNEAICRLCRKQVMTKQGNTTNLRSHLRVHHPAQFARLDSVSAGEGTATSTGTSRQLSVHSPNQQNKKETVQGGMNAPLLWRYLAKGMMPLHTVEKSSFREMIETLDRQYELPSWKYIKYGLTVQWEFAERSSPPFPTAGRRRRLSVKPNKSSNSRSIPW